MNFRSLFVLYGIILCLCSSLDASEGKPDKWRLEDKGMTRIQGGSLLIRDNRSDMGSSAWSSDIQASPGKYYTVSFKAKGSQPEARGNLAGVYIVFFTDKGLDRKLRERTVVRIPASTSVWRDFKVSGKAPLNVKYFRVWIHSFSSSKGEVELKNFKFASSDHDPDRPATKKPPVFTGANDKDIVRIEKLIPNHIFQACPVISDRAYWNRVKRINGAKSLLSSAKSRLQVPPASLSPELYRDFSLTGKRGNFEKNYRQRSENLKDYVFAECMENQGRFIEQINNYVEAIISEKTWVLPAHDRALENFTGKMISVDLGAEDRASLLAVTCLALGNKLKPGLEARVKLEIKRRIIDPYLEKCRSGKKLRGFWWLAGTNNWNPVCNDGVVFAAITTCKSKRTRAEVIANAISSVKNYLDDFPADGYCSEGIGYWDYGFGAYLHLAAILSRYTGSGIDLLKNEKVEVIAKFADNLELCKGRFPAFSDNTITVSGISPFMAVTLNRYWGRPVDYNKINIFSKSAEQIVASINLIEGKKHNAPKTAQWGEQRIRGWFPNAAVLVSRTNSPPLMGVAVKAGNNGEHHNHNDVGSYTINYDGLMPCCDPGRETYTARTFSKNRYDSKLLNSWGHPVPLVAGQLQREGAEFKGRIINKKLTVDHDSIDIDMKSAYLVPGLKLLQRSLLFDRKDHNVTVSDRFEYVKPDNFGTAIITYDRFKVTGNDSILVYNEKYCFLIKIIASGGKFAIKPEMISEDNGMNRKPWRIGIDFVNKIQKGSITIQYKPVPLADSLEGIYRSPQWNDGTPDEKKVFRFQAESFSSEKSGRVQVCSKNGDSGKSLKFWRTPGHILRWHILLPAPGRYAVRVKYCSALPDVSIGIKVEGSGKANDFKVYSLPGTGGWSSSANNWRILYLSNKREPLVLDLSRKYISVDLKLITGAANLDWIELVPLKR